MKRVIVIASGETERRALPQLVSHLSDEGVFVDEVLIPPGNRAITVDIVERLIKVVWNPSVAEPPDKVVILVDTDRVSPQEATEVLSSKLPPRLGYEIASRLQFAYAQRHLEAWYFADASNLRGWLGGGALGNVDASRPDELHNPKLHLKNLLGEQLYTARVSEEIAASLDARTIAQRSPSFRCFLEAVMNGGQPTSASSC